MSVCVALNSFSAKQVRERERERERGGPLRLRRGQGGGLLGFIRLKKRPVSFEARKTYYTLLLSSPPVNKRERVCVWVCKLEREREAHSRKIIKHICARARERE